MKVISRSNGIEIKELIKIDSLFLQKISFFNLLRDTKIKNSANMDLLYFTLVQFDYHRAGNLLLEIFMYLREI